MKCVYCGEKTKLGIHELCWIELKRYLLSNINETDTPNKSNHVTMADNATYIDRAGRHVVQGRVVVPVNPDEIY